MAVLSNKAKFQYPITPSSRTSLLDLCTEPTHRIAGDMLTIAFNADPEVVREFVPEPIELDGSGLCYLRFFDTWVYTDRQSTEFVSAERVNFGECFFWVPCTFEGELYHYMPFSWVNRDWLAYLGRTAGQPHKWAKVQMTRFHPADPVYYGPHEGVRISFSVDCVGRVLQGYLDLEREFERHGGELPISISVQTPKYLARRFFWDVVNDEPLVDDLVFHNGDDRDFGPIWGGGGKLEFLDAENEEAARFKPTGPVHGWWHTMRFHHKDSQPEILHSFK